MIDDETTRHFASIVRAALEGKPLPPARVSPLEALALVDDAAMLRQWEATAPAGEQWDEVREPLLMAVLRPDVADRLAQFLSQRAGGSAYTMTAIEFVEWLIKRHNFRTYMCPDGTIHAKAGDLTEEAFDLNLLEATRRTEIDRLHDALLAIDLAYTNSGSPAEALAAIRRITQAVLHPDLQPAGAGEQG